ncbi:hypothetical protein LTR78_003242 [Recurvomyces mirabilis]|uniref:Peptidase A1 domain-containing protein n=1 Tax=Recurvomyces mirabilis TaxID=574656 RepID=A0AAE0WS52_9PEZI|nr:hypothetical protein LTR78_003242 [Recurvomyces mirabilis]KAK5156941.1 hypothetical protein LTS14_004458 [Recurvomyces mirabilis]
MPLPTPHTNWLTLVWLCIPLLATTEPGVVRMNMARAQDSLALHGRSTPSVRLINDLPRKPAYHVNASIGMPGQMVSLILDTGSSDLWMFAPIMRSALPDRATGICDLSSSTYREVSKEPFDISYVDGTHVTGTYMQDTLAFGDSIMLSNLTMAIVDKMGQGHTGGMGIMGIASNAGEAAVEEGARAYPNFMDLMVEQKLIASKTYSLDLGGRGAQPGSILFGGYDTSRMEGNLSFLSLQPLAGRTAYFAVPWTSFTLTDNDGTRAVGAGSELNLTAEFDSGTSMTYVPVSLFVQLITYFNAHSCHGATCLVSCDVAN